MQVHDFNGGVTSSGLFWIVHIPNSALQIAADRSSATLTVSNARVVDTPPSGGMTAASVTYRVTWTAHGTSTHYEPGSTDPTDPTDFRGTFLQQSSAVGTFSGSESGFAFSSNPGASSSGLFAEYGAESNGSFLN